MEAAHAERQLSVATRAPLIPKQAIGQEPAATTGNRDQTSRNGVPALLTESPVRVSARQQDVVALLWADATDVQIAKALGVSVRTVRKDVADLMSQFGARSRFALGGAIALHLVSTSRRVLSCCRGENVRDAIPFGSSTG